MTDMTSSTGHGEPPADQAEGDGDQREYAEQRANYDTDSGGDVERGAAEESSGAPLTDTEKQVSQPPGER